MSTVLVLMPKAACYPGDCLADVGDLGLYEAPDEGRDYMRFALSRPIDLRLLTQDAPPAYVPIETITLARSKWGREEVYPPRERRRMAREGRRGRRGARSVPMGRRWRFDMFAPPDVPERTQRMVAELVRSSPTATIWRCPWWRRGVSIWSRGR